MSGSTLDREYFKNKGGAYLLVTLYSNNCPRCKILEQRLKEHKIDFNIINDEDLMIAKGFQTSPILEVDGDVMNFSESIKWVMDNGKLI